VHRASDPQQALKQGPNREQRSVRVGLGLRAAHYDELLRRDISVDFAEATSENFLGRGGRADAVLERVRAQLPVALHGVSLSIGGVDPLNERYLSELCALARRIEASSVSDHLCFGTFGGHYAHDLWPLPYTEEAVAHVVSRVAQVQERLGRQLLLENVSSYVEFRASNLSEWEFLSEVSARAGCGILLDVNNVFVSATNLGFSPEAYLARANRCSKCTWPATATAAGFCSTTTAHLSRTTSGDCTSKRSHASAKCRRSSSGTNACQR
jgi:uncharacterized protein (UPF0276 family)